jgi:hypothetical protein
MLQRQVEELTEKSEQENYAILGKLAEKEKETEVMKKQVEEMKTRQIGVEQIPKKMFVYEYDVDIDLKNQDVLERETLEETLRRVNISNRRLRAGGLWLMALQLYHRLV